jgi:hypothetical protein
MFIRPISHTFVTPSCFVSTRCVGCCPVRFTRSFKLAVGRKTVVMDSSSQTSISSSDNGSSSSSRPRRSHQLVFEGQYEESSDDEYELFEEDDFEDVAVVDTNTDVENKATKRKTNINTHANVHKKKRNEIDANHNDNNVQQPDEKKRKKREESSKNKKNDRLEWIEKRENTSHPLPVFRQRNHADNHAHSSLLSMFHLFFTTEWMSSIVAFMNSYSLLTHHYNINTNVDELCIHIHSHLQGHSLSPSHSHVLEERSSTSLHYFADDT